MHLLFLLTLSLLGSHTYAQNLIPNPGFENLNSKPTRYTAKTADFDNNMVDWFSSNRSSPDIISDRMNDRTRSYELPEAHSGEAMIGLINNLGMWTEYISAELKTPIQSGKTYYAEVWYMVLTPKNSNTTIQPSFENPNFGFWFNDGKPFHSTGYINETPHIASASTGVLTAYQWKKLSGTFTAQEDLTHLSFGQFEPSTKRVINGCILIDDILLEETDAPTLAVGTTIVLENVIFKSGTAVLESESFVAIEELHGYLTTDPNLQISINGHTDNVGSDADNLLLSEQRAATIYQYLIDKDIAESRLKYQGFGESNPITSNKSGSGRKKNRRVEFEVLSKT